MKISKFGKTIILFVFTLLFFGSLYLYIFFKVNISGRSNLKNQFTQNLTTLTRNVKYDAVIFQGKNLETLKNSFPNNVEIIEYNPKDDMVKMRDHLKNKTFILMWSIDEETYRLPKMTYTYRLFFTDHKKTLYAPFEKEAEKRFSWQNDHYIKVQYYLFEKSNT